MQVAGKPMADILDHWVEHLNELLVSCYLYLLTGLTNFNGMISARVELGFCLLATVFIAVLASILKTTF